MAAIITRSHPAYPESLHSLNHPPQDDAVTLPHSGNGVVTTKLPTSDRAGVLKPRNANEQRTGLIRKDPVLENAFRIVNNLLGPGDGEAHRPVNASGREEEGRVEEAPNHQAAREAVSSEASASSCSAETTQWKVVSHTKEDIRRVKRITEAVEGPGIAAARAPATLSDAIYAWEEELEEAGMDNNEFPHVLAQLRALSKEATARSSLNSSVAEHADASATAVKVRIVAGLTQIRRALVRQACEAAVESASLVVAQQQGWRGRRRLSLQGDEAGGLPGASASPLGARRHTLGALVPVQQRSPELPSMTDSTSPASATAFDGLPGASSSPLDPQGAQQGPPGPPGNTTSSNGGVSRKLQLQFPQCIEEEEEQQQQREAESPVRALVRMWDNILEEEGGQGDEEDSGWPSRERLSGALGTPRTPLAWVNPVAERSSSPGSSPMRQQVPLKGLEESFSNPLAEEEDEEGEDRWRGGGSGSPAAQHKQQELVEAVAAENAAVRRILSWFLSGMEEKQQQQEQPPGGSSNSSSSPSELLQWLSGATGRPLPQVCADLGTQAVAAAEKKQDRGKEGGSSCSSSINSSRSHEEEEENGGCPGLRQMRPAPLELELVRLIKHLSSTSVVAAAENCS